MRWVDFDADLAVRLDIEMTIGVSRNLCRSRGLTIVDDPPPKRMALTLLAAIGS
ncbi:hypothetical protein [Rhizobium sp. LjRoot258]|uniref:hypothetical protein n=1 Tax=Rhizobium sp. LjRoot258 TaxID=3342299 RepID=UPI003ED14AB7